MSTDIFLSYASEDTPRAMELARVLTSDGWSVWSDQEVSPGLNVEIESARVRSQARLVVVLWSVFSVASNRVKNAAKEAKESNKLIPVLLEDARIPLSYRSMSTADLRDWPDSQSPMEISRFKSAVSRFLRSGVSDQVLKKSSTAEEMTLSVRVAGRLGNMVLGSARLEEKLATQDFSLAIERCITDILLEILRATQDTVESNIDAYIMQLAAIFRASIVICSNVNFSRMNVSEIRSISSSKITATQEKTVLGYVNQHCSPSGEHNLRLEWDQWPAGKMLCLPLSQNADGREFAWFIATPESAEWTQDIQERLLKLASGMKAVINRTSAD